MPMIFIFWGFCTGSGQQISTLVFGSLYGATIVSAVDPLDDAGEWLYSPTAKIANFRPKTTEISLNI